MPKGISLHVGVNEYDADAYKLINRFPGMLPNSNRDAYAYLGIAKRFRFDPAVLIDKEATAAEVLMGIEAAAAHLEYGDMFFLTFSGHGCRIKDESNDEEDGYDETWCLYDRMILDDELFERWKLFRPGVRILVIADSCRSGTSIKNMNEIKPRKRFRFKRKGEDVQATILLLAACQDSQFAYTRSDLDNSLYTFWMLKIMQQYDFCKSYNELHKMVYSRMPSNSKPNLFKYGPGADEFIRSRPFRI